MRLLQSNSASNSVRLVTDMASNSTFCWCGRDDVRKILAWHNSSHALKPFSVCKQMDQFDCLAGILVSNVCMSGNYKLCNEVVVLLHGI